LNRYKIDYTQHFDDELLARAIEEVGIWPEYNLFCKNSLWWGLTVEDKCMHAIAKLAKEVNKGIKIIVGGPHPTIYYREIMEDENIDIAVIGEGEEAFLELLEYLEICS
jgi:hypothetical protein